MELAKMLIEKDEAMFSKEILYHLQRSFTEGDSNYDAQFWFARHHYLYKDRQIAARIFGTIRKAKLSPVQIRQVRGKVTDNMGVPALYNGTVKNMYDSYCFVTISELDAEIFVRYNEFKPDEWEKVTTGNNIRFNMAFTLRGPVGINASINT
ncbi:MAG: hypothetical protein A2W09_03515 [Deltaproteobacteria bacterium RBG_16_50_11]|nr:MAG: hypothetical protein A2W09_03515 [Deltaproteobacteria bacterium RBG_16_50_11]